MSHVLLESRSPAPQVTEHGPGGDHAPQFPATGQFGSSLHSFNWRSSPRQPLPGTTVSLEGAGSEQDRRRCLVGTGTPWCWSSIHEVEQLDQPDQPDQPPWTGQALASSQASASSEEPLQAERHSGRLEQSLSLLLRPTPPQLTEQGDHAIHRLHPFSSQQLPLQGSVCSLSTESSHSDWLMVKHFLLRCRTPSPHRTLQRDQEDQRDQTGGPQN